MPSPAAMVVDPKLNTAWLEPERHNESFAKNAGREKGGAACPHLAIRRDTLSMKIKPICRKPDNMEYKNETNLESLPKADLNGQGSCTF